MVGSTRIVQAVHGKGTLVKGGYAVRKCIFLEKDGIAYLQQAMQWNTGCLLKAALPQQKAMMKGGNAALKHTLLKGDFAVCKKISDF